MGPNHPLHRRSSLVESSRFAGLQYQIGPDNFFQVNTAQAEQLLPLLCSPASPRLNRRIVDA